MSKESQATESKGIKIQHQPCASGICPSKAAYPHDLEKARHLDAKLEELEKAGELKIMRIKGPYAEYETVPGYKKKVHLDHFWDHKSCNLCSINPGAAKSLWWIWDQLGIDYYNPDHQTSCTGWMYWATGIQSLPALVGVLARNWHECYTMERNFNIHCITSFATYTEARHWIIESDELRAKVRKYLKELGRELVVPESIVHVSDVIYALRDRIAEKAKYKLDKVTVAVHYGDHYWKGIMENAIGGYRPQVVDGLLHALGANVASDYSAFYECCGFGFRHIIMNRTMTRSQTFRKLKSIRDETHADLICTNCPGCGNTLDKNQWIQKARPDGAEEFKIPVLFPYQVASLCMGADPYEIAAVQFNSTPVEPFLEKAGIPFDKNYYDKFKVDEKPVEEGEGKIVIDNVDVTGTWSSFLTPRWVNKSLKG